MYGRPQKIGIFGGSFNPIHNGHLMLASAAADAFDLDPVLFVPNPNPPHKAGHNMPSGEIRTQMTAAAIGGCTRFALSTYELRRGHDCYTCNTLMHFRDKYPEDALYFIMGADSLKTFDTWKSPAVISSLAVLCVACRDDLEAERLEALAARMRRQYRADIRLLCCPAMDVSSTRIREMISRGEPVDELVPAAAVRILKQQRLYLPQEEDDP